MSEELVEFLNKYRVSATDREWTHAKLPGGKYYIPLSAREKFLELYEDSVFNRGINVSIIEYLGKEYSRKIRINVDFHYEDGITGRMYTKQHIIDIDRLYNAAIRKVMNLHKEMNIRAMILEKIEPDGRKDGFHIWYNITATTEQQSQIRKHVLEQIESESELSLHELPIINRYDDVFDADVCRNGIMMYGSTKPNTHSSYKLTSCISSHAENLRCTNKELIDMFSLFS